MNAANARQWSEGLIGSAGANRSCATVMTLAAVVLLSGCGPSYMTLRLQGQQAVVDDNYGVAAELFGQADRARRRRLDRAVDEARERFDDGLRRGSDLKPD